MKRMVTNIIFFLVVFLVTGDLLLLTYFTNKKFEEAAIEMSMADNELTLIMEELKANTKVLETLSNEIGDLEDKIFVIGETVEAMKPEKDDEVEDEVEEADPIQSPTPAPTPIPWSAVWIDTVFLEGNELLVNGNIKITFDETTTYCDMSFERDIRNMKYYICNNTKHRKVEISIVSEKVLRGELYNGRDYILDKSRAKAYRLAGDLYLMIAMPNEPWCQDDWQEECDYWLRLLDVECG